MYIPYTNSLVLAGQMDSIAIVEVVWAHLVRVWTKKELGATLGGKVGVVAGVLGYL